MSITVALCTPRLRPGAVDFNSENIKSCIAKAKKADLIVFPRLALSGATCGSMFGFPLLTRRALEALGDIAATDKTVIVGLPTAKDGKVFDSIAVCRGGKYTIYSPAKGIEDIGENCLSYGDDVIPDLDIDGVKVRVMPCFGDVSGADLAVIPTALPSYIGSLDELKSELVRLPAVALVSSGKGESVSGRIMSGDKIVAVGGKIEAIGGFDDEMTVAKIGKIKDKRCDCDVKRREISFTPLSDEECVLAFELMGRGILGRMNEIGTDKVIFGLSGGLDSANVLLACILAYEKYKLDKKNIICVTMRGGSSSRRTQDNASALIEAFKVTGINVPIDSAITLHMRSICHDKTDVVYENAQARERTQILLDLANKYNALMLGTGDLSEICLGWSTFGGDQLSQYDPNCSLTKTAIRRLMRYYVSLKHNRTAAKIIEDVLATPVSPELVDDQETEAILGPYELHDCFVREIVAKRRFPSEVVATAAKELNMDSGEVKKYLRLFLSRFFKYQFKRNFGPDGVKLFAYDLSDLVIRSDFSPELWLADCEVK